MAEPQRDPLAEPAALLAAIRARLEDDSDAYADQDLLARLYELYLRGRRAFALPQGAAESEAGPGSDTREQEALADEGDELIGDVLALAEYELGAVTNWSVTGDGISARAGVVSYLEMRVWSERRFASYRAEQRPGLRTINRLGAIKETGG